MADKKEQLQNAGKFQEAIFDYARIQSEKILQEVRSQQQEELKLAKAAIQKETSDYIRLHMEKVNSKVSREIAHREQDVKKEILKERQEITDKVFAEAKEQLKAFVQTADYLPFLLEQVKNAGEMFCTEDVIFVTSTADERYHTAIQDAFGRPCSFQIDVGIQIGGLQIKSAALGKMADQSLDSLLKDQEDWFTMHSGLSVV